MANTPKKTNLSGNITTYLRNIPVTKQFNLTSFSLMRNDLKQEHYCSQEKKKTANWIHLVVYANITNCVSRNTTIYWEILRPKLNKKLVKSAKINLLLNTSRNGYDVLNTVKVCSHVNGMTWYLRKADSYIRTKWTRP